MNIECDPEHISMVNQNWNSSVTTVDRQKGEESVF